MSDPMKCPKCGAAAMNENDAFCGTMLDGSWQTKRCRIAELESQLAAAVARAEAAERMLAAVRATLIKPPMDGYTLASSILDILDRKGE